MVTCSSLSVEVEDLADHRLGGRNRTKRFGSLIPDEAEAATRAVEVLGTAWTRGDPDNPEDSDPDPKN